MSPLATAQHMVAAALLTVALLHLLVWLRQHPVTTHLLFAVTALAAGGNAIAESNLYRATSVAEMATAVKWYVGFSGVWLIAFLWFMAVYAGISLRARLLTATLSTAFCVGLVYNAAAPYSLLYKEITGLRNVVLPWGETIQLAEGRDNPWRFVIELGILAVFAVIIDGVRCLRRRGERQRAWLFGVSVAVFMAFFGTHAMLVDTGRLDSPYLSSYGFLAVVVVMSNDLAGQIARAGELAVELARKDAALQTAVADERGRIAGDLHDSVTQALFSTAAIADALPEVWRRHPDEALRGLESLRQMTKGALAEMRTLLLELRPASLVEKRLDELLVQLAEATSARTCMPVSTEMPCQRRLPDDVQIALYRIAQEALHNVVKHARATLATLNLSRSSGTVVLTISDDGRGFDPQVAEPDRMGLEIMRERVRSIGGSLTIDSQPGRGTTVQVAWTSTTASGN